MSTKAAGRTLACVGTLWQDLKFGLRLMRRSPAFSLTAIVVLSLGIGVNTALFSIINALFFKPLPVRAPEELFYLYTKNEAGQIIPFFDESEIREYQMRGPDLADYTGHWRVPMRLADDDWVDRVSAEWVGANYFDVLGVRAALGRTLAPSEDDPANPEYAIVISHDLWTNRFGSDPDVIGRKVRLNTWLVTIVGVAEPGFEGLSDPFTPTGIWASGMQMDAAEEGRPSHSFIGGPIGRLRPGVTIDHLRAFFAVAFAERKAERLARLSTRVDAQEYEDSRRRLSASQLLVYRAVDTRMPFAPETALVPPAMLVGMVAVVGLVLLIAAANIAGLLLARGVTRTGEVAVRRALGAGGGRVTRQLLTEGVLLALAGGATGLAVATTLVGVFRAYTPSRFAVDVAVDVRVLLFAIAVCVGAGILVGLGPALQAARVNVLEALGSGIVGARVVRSRLRYWIVMPQVALSLVLLLVAAVHVVTLLRIERADPGYSTDRAIVFSIGRWEPREPVVSRRTRTRDAAMAAQEKDAAAVRQFHRAIVERVGRLPQVSAFAVGGPPLTPGYGGPQSVMSQDTYNAGERPNASAQRSVVSDGYFDVMGMRLVAGRTFDDRDGPYEAFGTRVVVIDETTARTVWPAGDAIGQVLGVFPAVDFEGKAEWLQVIGIVNDVQPILTNTARRPHIYVSLAQQWRGSASTLIVRGAGDQRTLIRDVKAAVVGADAFAEVSSVRTMDQMVGEILYPRRIAAAILAAAGLIGLLLACIGLYGVMSYSLAQRQREIGIRTSLGADRGDIVRLVLREAAAIVASATAAGFVIAIVALRATANLLPGTPAADAVSFVAVPVVLAAIIGAAAFVPARRACRVDPAQVLRGSS
jgi:putative ABC transport system permease protein